MPPTYVTAYNPTDGPVTVDDLGRSIGGHSWGPARRSNHLDYLANTGSLVVVTQLDEHSAGDDARLAARTVDELNAAADKWANVDLAAIRQAAADNLKLDTDPLDADGYDRAQLVDLLAHAGITPPAKSSRSPKTATTPED